MESVVGSNHQYYALKKNYNHKIDRWNSEYYATYNFAEYRNRVTRKINKDNPKILILGDSFTFGLYLKDQMTYIDKLQNKFNQYYFVNSSTPGWGLEDYYLFTKDNCELIKPQKIIIILNDGDLGRIRENVIIDKQVSLKEKYFLYKLMIENFMTISFLREKIYKIINRTQEKETNYLDTTINFNTNVTKSIIKDSIELFLILKNISISCQSELNIINLGWSKSKNSDKLTNPKNYFLFSDKNFFLRNNINFFDNTMYLKNVHKNKANYIIKNEGHPNEKGSDMIYKSLLNHFELILN